ncbi:MAG: DUF523 domain-containing protein [Candidatus Izemoplasmatales bacterium]|jgi:uncharacterized protein YbbK (DUF523 family)|nr:DUF523 domain-containing protein [Candidatus Izemoplasmatales bacterium]
MKDKLIAVSACLIGVNCKYNGKNNLNNRVMDYLQGKEVILICPEELGGLTTPRIESEIQQNGSVINKVGLDVTENFHLGAQKALAKMKKYNCEYVILKDGSPSCGYKNIYDGSFTGKRIRGQGISARYFIENGIKIIDLET